MGCRVPLLIHPLSAQWGPWGGRGASGISGASAYVTVHSPQCLLSFPTSCPRFLPGPVSSLRGGLLPSPPQVPVRQGSVFHTRVPKASLRRAAPGPGCVWTACPLLSSHVDRKSQLGRLDRMQQTGVGAAQVCFLADLEAGSQGRGSRDCVLSSLLGVWTPSRLLTCSLSCVWAFSSPVFLSEDLLTQGQGHPHDFTLSDRSPL